MKQELIDAISQEEKRGVGKWGATDTKPEVLLNVATEELGEIAHAINHDEGFSRVQQEIADLMGVLSRLYDMVDFAGDNSIFIRTTNSSIPSTEL